MQEKLPQVFLHLEDFVRTNAYRHLIKYRDITCSFNDGIQGTGIVTLAAILAALRITKNALFEQQCIVVFGAGTASISVPDTLFRAVSQNGLF